MLGGPTGSSAPQAPGLTPESTLRTDTKLTKRKTREACISSTSCCLGPSVEWLARVLRLPRLAGDTGDTPAHVSSAPTPPSPPLAKCPHSVTPGTRMTSGDLLVRRRLLVLQELFVIEEQVPKEERGQSTLTSTS